MVSVNILLFSVIYKKPTQTTVAARISDKTRHTCCTGTTTQRWWLRHPRSLAFWCWSHRLIYRWSEQGYAWTGLKRGTCREFVKGALIKPHFTSYVGVHMYYTFEYTHLVACLTFRYWTHRRIHRWSERGYAWTGLKRGTCREIAKETILNNLNAYFGVQIYYTFE